ncbi:hypothetical protein ACFSM5_00885 [Lacibacterium aquatile]|uniref:DUF7831 domain-containing protein n=1 Tax=Lacibacterium aquatile TaxID=1168082 RepID=A0ABW5DJZ6_9PROT
MPLIFQTFITRADIQANPDKLYIFGDNEQRKGMGGQAIEFRGEPNAVGIATKIEPRLKETSFWSDDDYDRCIAIVDADFDPVFAHARNGGTIICPEAGLGTGLAQLSERAPRILAHLQKRLKELAAL